MSIRNRLGRWWHLSRLHMAVDEADPGDYASPEVITRARNRDVAVHDAISKAVMIIMSVTTAAGVIVITTLLIWALA